MTKKRNWTFLTSHAVVLLHIVKTPDDTIKKIAQEVNLAERTVAAILSDLRKDGYVAVTKRGKTNFYTLNPDMPMRRPAHAHYSVRTFFAPLDSMMKRTLNGFPTLQHKK
jgi:predicted transcriptional regulator